MVKKITIWITVLIILSNIWFFFYINKVNGEIYYYEESCINPVDLGEIYNMTPGEIYDYYENTSDYHTYHIYGNLFNSSLFTAEGLTVNSKSKNVWVDSTSLSEGYLKLLPGDSYSFSLCVIVKINDLNYEKAIKKIKVEIDYFHNQLFFLGKTTIHSKNITEGNFN